MEEQNQDSVKPTPKAANTTPIRVNKSTARMIKNVVNKVNKIPLGKRVLIDQILVKALSLLTEDHLQQIKESTYTSKDFLEIEHKKYCSTNQAISMEDFILKILKLNGGLQ